MITINHYTKILDKIFAFKLLHHFVLDLNLFVGEDEIVSSSVYTILSKDQIFICKKLCHRQTGRN